MATIGRWEKADADSSVDILSTLIGFPTTHRDSNLNLIEWIRDYLSRHGLASRLVFDGERRKANLLASLGPASDNGIVLSGHTDVVPVDGQHWHSDPFTATVRDGRVYGRGSCDMKGFIAVVLAQLPHWKRLPLRRPIHFAFTYDEEVGCLGVQSLIVEMENIGLRAAGCIVGEPTGIEPVIAHKGRIVSNCCVRGRAVHSSLAPFGVNAIDYAARMICFIQDLMATEAETGLRQAGFDVPFSTMATTLVQGGNSQNTIPDCCEFTFDFRYLPGVDPYRTIRSIAEFKERLVSEMQQRDASADILLSHEETSLPLSTGEESAIVALTKVLSSSTRTGKVAYGTEAGYFDRIGIPTVVCGPGSIEQAHRPNEFIEIAQLEAYAGFLANLGRKLCD